MTIPEPHELVDRYEHRAKKRFGQHFLTDFSILNRIADAAGIQAGDRVLEIGPGPGSLTAVLLARGARVTAIEVDEDAALFLQEHLVPHGLELLVGDARKIDLGFVTEGWKAAANLPYNVANEITFALLERPFSKLALMYQKEVADRMCADAGDDAYGSLSVAIRVRAEARRAFVLPPGAFRPPPKVNSAVVTFTPVPGMRIVDADERAGFERVVRGAFSVRRKTLVNGLRTLGLDREQAVAAVEAAGLDPQVRPERVDFDGFVRLARAVAEST